MKPFCFARPTTVADALKLLSKTARPKGGGNDLLDLAKRGVSTPDVMVDLGRAEVRRGRVGVDVAGEGLQIGALTTLAQIATDATIASQCPLLADAAAEAATPQIRNTATIAGNVLQRPRCAYFRDPFFDCLKRGGTTCPARSGVHDEMAVFGNVSCCAVHPSNLATAFTATRGFVLLERAKSGAKVDLRDARQSRIEEFFVGPDEDPLREARIDPEELIVGFLVGRSPASAYVEINQKQSYDWASVACAVVLDVDGGKITDARVALGAVAPVPLLSKGAADALRGKPLRDTAAWDAAAAAACEGATPLPRNGHKVRQLRAVVRRAIEAAAARAK